jgi:hypothetical protein
LEPSPFSYYLLVVWSEACGVQEELEDYEHEDKSNNERSVDSGSEKIEERNKME